MNDIENFNSIFIKEFRPGNILDKEKPEYVYHYTSPDALLSIIKNGSVRFTDVRYMNDKSESIFFVKRLIEFCEKRKNDYPLFLEAVNELLKGNDYNKIKDLSIEKINYHDFPGLSIMKNREFIFCTCQDADSLNMWNYYASNGTYRGYNVGFSIYKFLKTFDVDLLEPADAFSVHYGNVIYLKKKQFEAIEELAKRIERYLSYADKQSIQRAAIIIRNYITNKGLFFKDESFKSENEYRFLISIAEKRIPHNKADAEKYSGEYNKNLTEDFCAKNGLIVPFMNVSIPKNSICRITLSPMTEFEIAKSSINELLKINNIKSTSEKNIPIYKSNIPIRF